MEISGVYSFSDVVASITGPGIAAPLGAGAANAQEGITISMAEDKNTMTVGADGNGMHSLHAGKSGSITIRLLKTSPINRLLQNAYNLQTNGGSALHGKNTLIVSNLQSGDVITGRACAFKKEPDVNYAVEGGMNEWVFESIFIDMRMGSGSPALGAFGF